MLGAASVQRAWATRRASVGEGDGAAVALSDDEVDNDGLPANHYVATSAARKATLPIRHLLGQPGSKAVWSQPRRAQDRPQKLASWRNDIRKKRHPPPSWASVMPPPASMTVPSLEAGRAGRKRSWPIRIGGVLPRVVEREAAGVAVLKTALLLSRVAAGLERVRPVELEDGHAARVAFTFGHLGGDLRGVSEQPGRMAPVPAVMLSSAALSCASKPLAPPHGLL